MKRSRKATLAESRVVMALGCCSGGWNPWRPAKVGDHHVPPIHIWTGCHLSVYCCISWICRGGPVLLADKWEFINVWIYMLQMVGRRNLKTLEWWRFSFLRSSWLSKCTVLLCKKPGYFEPQWGSQGRCSWKWRLQKWSKKSRVLVWRNLCIFVTRPKE